MEKISRFAKVNRIKRKIHGIDSSIYTTDEYFDICVE